MARSHLHVLHVLAPALLGFVLFAAAMYVFVIPETRHLLRGRQERTAKELTSISIQTVDSYYRLVRQDVLSSGEAQARALEALRSMRYGPDGRNYFWVINLEPRLLMHPYRGDLEGQNVASYTDPEGVRVFGEMVDIVEEEGSGYLDYQWQLHGDTTRVGSKRSYVELFRPWEWIVGTGIYLEQARAQASRLTRHVTIAAAVTLFIMGLAVAYQAIHALRLAHTSEAARVELLRSLREKEILLSEVHHRVKNNLQIISSMLHLQQEGITDEATQHVLEDSQTRIDTMALVHSFLYSSTSFSAISFSDYVEELVANLAGSYSTESRNIEVETQVAEMSIGIGQAVAYALIVTELATNAFKHAFPDDCGGMVRIGFSPAGDGYYHLEVSDNGVGFDPQLVQGSSGSLGMTLVEALVEQLDGSLHVISDGGTLFRVVLPVAPASVNS